MTSCGPDKDKLLELLQNGALELRWKECLESWQTIQDNVDNLLQRMLQERDDIVASFINIQDPEDLRDNLAIVYIEVKSRWIMLNTKIQFQLYRFGKSEDELIYRASLTSFFIDTMESQLGTEEIDQINSFLSDPLSKGL